MAIIRPDLVHDCGKIAADGTRIAGCFLGTPARASAGVYSYTYGTGSGLDSTESALIATANTAARRVASVHTSDVLLDVTALDNTPAAADSIWSFWHIALAV